jgi:hypothetical protein
VVQRTPLALRYVLALGCSSALLHQRENFPMGRLSIDCADKEKQMVRVRVAADYFSFDPGQLALLLLFKECI